MQLRNPTGIGCYLPRAAHLESSGACAVPPSVWSLYYVQGWPASRRPWATLGEEEQVAHLLDARSLVPSLQDCASPICCATLCKRKGGMVMSVQRIQGVFHFSTKWEKLPVSYEKSQERKSSSDDLDYIILLVLLKIIKKKKDCCLPLNQSRIWKAMQLLMRVPRFYGHWPPVCTPFSAYLAFRWEAEAPEVPPHEGNPLFWGVDALLVMPVCPLPEFAAHLLPPKWIATLICSQVIAIPFLLDVFSFLLVMVSWMYLLRNNFSAGSPQEEFAI